MNLTVFENKIFRFFTGETFLQGSDIIIQDQKIDKVFFIAEGQFEITTNLSLLNLYSLLHHKTGKEFDSEKLKKKFPNEEYNLRLYISQNKDILGLDDCCFENDVSFITAKCISDNCQVFTIDKAILNEKRVKMPEIDKNIIKIIIKREKVMIDRLMNIYNRIVLSRNKSKNQQFNENNKAQDSFKYINYFFGIKQGDKNSNAKKVKTKIANKKRVQSAFFLSQERKIFKLINEADSLNNEIYIDNNNSRFSIFKNNINRSKMSGKIKIIDAIRFYDDKINEKSSPKEKSKTIEPNEKKNNLNSSLKLKQSEIMDSSFQSNEKMFTLKSAQFNISSKEKSLGLHDSLNINNDMILYFNILYYSIKIYPLNNS
jgi:CRP-like cAMP-binding protein